MPEQKHCYSQSLSIKGKKANEFFPCFSKKEQGYKYEIAQMAIIPINDRMMNNRGAL